MNWRWLRSKWLGLVVCVAVGSLTFAILSLQALQDLMAVADALSSGIRDGLSDGGRRSPREEPRRVSVSFLFGLVQIEDTPYPYLWTTISGIVTGGILGVIAWGLFQLGLWAWRRKTHRAGKRQAEPAAAPDPARVQPSGDA